ncbi:MAG: sigma-70 family RNA polymerase sigma factor [Chitinophagaceae bacterium]|nr:sigma-70 family RNA polymerase sigma factor [Chitinophagaceae bacterium]
MTKVIKVAEYTLHTDKELFNLISDGNEQAFEELFLSYIPRLKPVVLQIIKEEGLVNDIIQDVFLSIWLERHKLDEIDEPRKWIFRLMYNRCFRWLQRQTLQHKAYNNIAYQQKEQSGADPALRVGLNETSRLIKQAIDRLSPQAKRIYYLKREEGRKLDEIAEELGISIQSVKNSLHRSGRSIKDYLAEYDIYIPLILLIWA